MESEDNSVGDGVSKPRPVLADVTNRPEKRPFALFSGDDLESHLRKQVRLGLDSLMLKKCQSQFAEKAQHYNKDKILLQPQVNEKEKESCFKLPLEKNALGVVGDKEKESCFMLPLDKNPLGVVGDKGEGRSSPDRVDESRDKNISVVANLELPQFGATENPTTVSASDDGKFLGLEMCSQVKSDGGANSVANVEDLVKSCTCSFCSKAAYIWSDLHYQDIKGRISAVKKSQKEASNIVQKISGLKDTVMHDPQRSAESFELEFSLMHQWKSLFVHMENTYAQEISQFESKSEELKNLRDNCKNDLELDETSHRDKQ